jgi:hypothetical protein
MTAPVTGVSRAHRRQWHSAPAAVLPEDALSFALAA